MTDGLWQGAEHAAECGGYVGCVDIDNISGWRYNDFLQGAQWSELVVIDEGAAVKADERSVGA